MRWKKFAVGRLHIRLFAGRDELGVGKEWGIMVEHYGMWMLYVSLGTWVAGVEWGRVEEEKGDAP